jgi:hypothetical protein
MGVQHRKGERFPAILIVLFLPFVLIAVGLASPHAWANSSGLNNIPATDVTPINTLVLQNWNNLADGESPAVFTGFKLGALEGLEMGLDWKASGDPHAHLTFQAKYAFDIKQDVVKGVLGIANLSEHRAHTGEPFPYVATSYDFNVLRGHLGFNAQEDNEGFFVGIDRTVSFLGRNLQLKADAIQFDNMDDVLFSAGFLYDFAPLKNDDGQSPESSERILEMLTKNFVFETWVNVPTSGDEEFLTLKLNYVIKF